MARYAWGRTLLTAFGTAAVIGLAQLGAAYGLTIVDWRQDTAGLWSANMAWTTWLAAISAIAGALAGARTGESIATRIAAVLAAGVGASVIGPLMALPAREPGAHGLPGTPFLAVGIGVATGMALALIAMAARPVAWSLMASTGLVWLLALLSAFAPIGDRSVPSGQLGVWGTWAGVTGALGKRGLALAPPLIIGSLLIGVIVAWIASAGGRGHRVAAASGVAGPLLVTVAYMVAGPGTGSTVDSMSAFLIGPYAALAGLIGSLTVSALRKEKSEPVPTDDKEYPLPRRDAEDTVYERIPSPSTPPDPYIDDYTKALDEVDSSFAPKDEPQPAREGEDVPAPPPMPPSDETESWVSELKTDSTKSVPTKRTRRPKE
ncbi:hypothetical protein Afil01_60920 [Actinorhabdospora filicis]|uniref:Uncharacterized protein n=1 Tax=Actinorhabdospora filicis TaxID=1785913 RepID=A0A9W6SSR6_9ACTN|nr:hypothetical protein [Actinorhabdospora filicis]GLZ81285.1 hypothetical protein Afil01_60920 [Actinorhabdospora filicis]